MVRQEEHRVISLVLDGDADAYAILVKRYERPIYNLMLRMTASPQDALDLTQTTFIKAYDSLERFRAGRSFFPWLYTIGLNQAKDFLRRRKLELFHNGYLEDVADKASVPADQEERLISQARVREVQSALKQISWDYREAIILRFYENLSVKDVAAALGLSLSAAKMRVHRGLAMLRHILLDNGYG